MAPSHQTFGRVWMQKGQPVLCCKSFMIISMQTLESGLRTQEE